MEVSDSEGSEEIASSASGSGSDSASASSENRGSWSVLVSGFSGVVGCVWAVACAAGIGAGIDRGGAVGGGAPVWLGKGEVVPLYVRFIAILALVGAKLIGFTGGAFMYCTREAFLATGGFDEHLYWSEENSFALALKREGRFVVLWHYVLTSGRRFRAMSGLQMLAVCARTALSPSKMTTRRASVEKVWYDSNRANDGKMPNSLAVKVSNGLALLIIIVLVTWPVWNFIPRSWMPWDSLFGKFRFFIRGFICHVGLVLWPCAFVLFRNLLRQKRWTGLVQSMALIAFCVWQAWGATRGVIWFWTWLFYWLAHFHGS